jgi:hypothetical protein
MQAGMQTAAHEKEIWNGNRLGRKIGGIEISKCVAIVVAVRKYFLLCAMVSASKQPTE